MCNDMDAPTNVHRTQNCPSSVTFTIYIAMWCIILPMCACYTFLIIINIALSHILWELPVTQTLGYQHQEKSKSISLPPTKW